MKYFPELFEAMLQERGLSDGERDNFLNPDYEKLHDPLLLPDMARARDRLIGALKNNEHITIFSDYDADGIPGAVVLSDFFRRINYDNISFYIPHRHNEGFGLSLDVIEECLRRGTSLLITIDCGVVDFDEVLHAQNNGIDVIITDHHKTKDKLPKAYAVINPNREDSKYEFKELCGSAVVFKLVQAVMNTNTLGVKPGLEKWSLDMVAIATLSDMVPLLGENRILSRFGLEVLRKSPRPGLAALFKRARLDQKNLTEDDVVFMITPRINAASRMGVSEDALKLLRTNDPIEADRLSLHLEKINNQRKGVVASIIKDAKSHLDKREKISEVIVIGNPEWRPGLLGLVANSLVEEYARPAFVWGRDGNGLLKGSCRAPENFDLVKLMNFTADYFTEFGGHAGAGGFSTSFENLLVLEEKLSLEAAEAKVSVENVTSAISLPISLSDIGENLWQTVSLFAPFGVGNRKPIFKIPNAEIKSIKTFGKEGNHLEVLFNGGSREVKAISFFSSPENFGTPLLPGIRVNVLANLEKSYFGSRPELRLRILDIIKI